MEAGVVKEAWVGCKPADSSQESGNVQVRGDCDGAWGQVEQGVQVRPQV